MTCIFYYTKIKGIGFDEKILYEKRKITFFFHRQAVPFEVVFVILIFLLVLMGIGYITILNETSFMNVVC